MQPQENQEIEQAIQRLSEKMRHVSASLEMTRAPVTKTAANQNRAETGKKKGAAKAHSTPIISRLLKYLLLVCILGGITLGLASLISLYLDQMRPQSQAQGQAETPAQTSAGALPQDSNAQLPAAPASAPAVSTGTDTAPQPAAKTAPQPLGAADFALRSARYQAVETELGPALDIYITVVNTGTVAGQPELFEIELVDANNKQLMGWPMAVAATAIDAGAETIFKTRLLEPPLGFKNIRVSMKK